IAFDPYNGGAVSCSWNSVTKEYLISWISGISAENYARRISQTGAYVGETFRSNGLIAGGIELNLDPLACANSVNNDYMICWQNNYTDVYVRRFKGYAPITFPTSLVSIDLGTTNIENGMTHPLGGDGDTI